MTQPFTSDDRSAQKLSGQGVHTEGSVEQLSLLANNAQPAIIHPNFDPRQTALDPARPLSDIPEPTRRVNGQLNHLYGRSGRFHKPHTDNLSKWQLLASESFADYLGFLKAAQLIALPDSFYHNHSEQPLLMSLDTMTLLDMADIGQVIKKHPQLTRYGFMVDNLVSNNDKNNDNKINTDEKQSSLRAIIKRYNPNELLNSIYADDWQVILQPEQFESGVGSLATDIMACSVAVHVLSQCATRKSINHSYSAEQICQYVRSYILSQVCRTPALRYQYRQIRLFAGHIIVAAQHLGWELQIAEDGHCYFNVSSRCGLLTRYANMQDYAINGWSS
ncbi:hypothetical protein [Psychrobacter sp. GP33]|uniref:hypothetical protein n=1 Tax=Psychrobacter sp. GP33 TaxID=2758709 RepID=UPI0015F9F140|nr:hypothetical protein [Psychrobacter sp. GP33]